VATPVFSFSAEILTDAPFEVVAARLREPASFKCLSPFGPWSVVEEGDALLLRWTRTRLGSEERGEVRIAPHERGAHLRLEARHRGWAAFGSFGMLRWHGDQLLDRLVEEL
jgi:hypothetical protein